MVQMSSFYIKSDEKKIYTEIKKYFKEFPNAVVVQDDGLKSAFDLDMPWEQHEKIFKRVYSYLINEQISFTSKNEYYSDGREYHEHGVCLNKQVQRYITSEIYDTGESENLYYYNDEQFEEDSWDLEEVMCCECGEYFKKHENAPYIYCPYCGHIEELEEVQDEVVEAKWKKYDFEIPLGIELPEQPISVGQDWLSDCEEDSVYGLNPACYESQIQYNAALRLCRICSGWFRFDSEEEKATAMECMRAVIQAKKGEPMWYYDIWQNSFDWLNALRDNHPKYQGKFLAVNDLWDLFSRLQQRSYIDKAECFDWFIEFFGDCLKFETRYKMSDTYVQNYYDNHMESMLYLYPHQVDILTKSVARVSSRSCAALARNAAGLIRMGKRDLGLSMYKKTFAMVWADKASVEDKKSVVDNFIERLAMGYEDEQYIDDEIATLLEKQCNKYSDGAWSSKIRMNLGRNKR